jgi:hypothetical protein
MKIQDLRNHLPQSQQHPRQSQILFWS